MWHKLRKEWKKLGGKRANGKETKGYKSVTAEKRNKISIDSGG
jgi:hypothetical protein